MIRVGSKIKVPEFYNNDRRFIVTEVGVLMKGEIGRSTSALVQEYSRKHGMCIYAKCDHYSFPIAIVEEV